MGMVALYNEPQFFKCKNNSMNNVTCPECGADAMISVGDALGDGRKTFECMECGHKVHLVVA